MIERIKQYLRPKLIEIESLPPFRETVEISTCRYPFERSLDDYLRKLPGLRKELRKNSRVLDIGAGSCAALLQLRDVYGFDVHGTNIRQGSDASLDIQQCEADRLSFGDSFFDLVISVQALSWEPNQIQALREVYRVLKDGGKAYLYFTPFGYSIEHRIGEDFWSVIGVSKDDYEKVYGVEGYPKDNDNVKILRVDLKHPYNEYTYAYYIEIDKREEA